MLFPPTSRYSSIDTAQITTPDGRTLFYIKRRFVPPPENFSLLREYVVTEGDRLDNITARQLGDHEQFWQVCDSNGAMRPDELTEKIGRRLSITLPEGIPGIPNV